MSQPVLYVPFLDLVDTWRSEGAHLRDRYGEVERAQIYTLAADDLTARLKKLPELTVDYDQAADSSIWTRGTIRNKVARGELTNVGTRGAPELHFRTLALSGQRLLRLPHLLED